MQEKAKALVKRILFITSDIMSTDTTVFLLSAQIPYINKPFDALRLKKEIDRIISQQS